MVIRGGQDQQAVGSSGTVGAPTTKQGGGSTFAELAGQLARFTAPGVGKSRHLSLAEAQTLAQKVDGAASLDDAKRFRALMKDLLGVIEMRGPAVDVACEIAGVPPAAYHAARTDSGVQAGEQGRVALQKSGVAGQYNPVADQRSTQSAGGKFSPVGLQMARLSSSSGTKQGANGEDLSYVATYQVISGSTAANRLSNEAFARDKAGAFDEAVALYRLALNQTPEDPKIHNRLGLALKHKGDLAGAKASIHQSLQLDPKYGPAHYNDACLAVVTGDRGAAIAALAKAVAADPKFFGNLAKGDGDLAPIAKDPAFVAITSGKVGAHGENLAYVPDILADESSKANQLRNEALALDKAGQFDQAVAKLDEAIALDPNDPWLHSRKGLALKHKGDLDAAMASLDMSLDKDPNFGPGHYNQACIHMVQGDRDKALASLAKAVAQDIKLFGGHAKGDLDFAPIKSDPDFLSIVG